MLQNLGDTAKRSFKRETNSNNKGLPEKQEKSQ